MSGSVKLPELAVPLNKSKWTGRNFTGLQLPDQTNANLLTMDPFPWLVPETSMCPLFPGLVPS